MLLNICFLKTSLKQKKSSITGNLLPWLRKSIWQTAISHLMKMAISCTMTSWSATLLTDQTVIVADDFSGDLDEYRKNSRTYTYEYYNPNGVIDIYSVRKQDTLLILRHLSQNKQQDGLFKTIQRKPLAGGFGNEELQIIANEFAPYNITPRSGQSVLL